MSFPIGSKVVLSPSFGCSFDTRANQRLKRHRSVLLAEGDVSFENVQLDGALSIKAENGSKILLKNLSVKNKSWNGTRNPTPRRKSPPVRIPESRKRNRGGRLLQRRRRPRHRRRSVQIGVGEEIIIIIIIRALRVSTSRQNRIIDVSEFIIFIYALLHYSTKTLLYTSLFFCALKP